MYKNGSKDGDGSRGEYGCEFYNFMAAYFMLVAAPHFFVIFRLRQRIQHYFA